MTEERAFERVKERALKRIAGVGDGGWFFAQIAGQVAEQRPAIARLERGGRPPRIDTLLGIAEALDCQLVVELRPRRG
jgi:transcriptional regulator with XRE-family HTH domain